MTIDPATDPDSEELTYKFQVSDAVDFDNILAESDFQASLTWQVDIELADNNCQPYYWQALAFDGDDPGDWAEPCLLVVNYIVEPPALFILETPQYLETLTDLQPALDWTDSFDPDCQGDVSYDIYLSETSTFIDELTYVFENVAESEYTLDFPLQDNQIYYWKVLAEDAESSTTFSNQTDCRFGSEV